MDMIVQNEGANGLADISFTVLRDDLPATLRAVDEAVKELGAEGCNYDDNVAEDLGGRPGHGHAARRGRQMFRALAEKGINIQMITTSEIKISVLVAREYAQEALRTVHEAFDLADVPARLDGGRAARPRAGGDNRPPTAT